MDIEIKKEYTKQQLYTACILSGFLTTILVLSLVQLEVSPQWVTNQHCDELVNISYAQGISDSLIDIPNNTIQTQLNSTGGK